MASVSTANTNGKSTGVGAGSPREGPMTSGGQHHTGNMGGGMHPAPSLIEAPPRKSPRPDYPRPSQQALHALSATQGPGQSPSNNFFTPYAPSDYTTGLDVLRQGRSSSPPLRQDTHLSTSTTATNATSNSLTSAATAASPRSTASSPSAYPGQNLPFSVNSSELGQGKKPNRRRTGPLNPEQREKAAIIRKMGACDDCRRRRVGCQPEHHSMTWKEAVERFGPEGGQDNSQSTGTNRQDPSPTSPSPVRGFRATNVGEKRFSQELDDETSPSAASEQPPQKIRKPLPSAPRLERTAQAVLSLSPEIAENANTNAPVPLTPSPHVIDSPGPINLPPTLTRSNSSGPPNPGLSGLETSRTVSGSSLHRYVAVHALLLNWEDELSVEVQSVTQELRGVFEEQYRYQCEIVSIPYCSEPSASSRWLLDKISRFNAQTDRSDVLKIVYYNGHSYIDRNREMVLANSLNTDRLCKVKWKPIQAILEETAADTLLIMDCPYLGPRASRKSSVMTVIASCDFNDYGLHPVPRCFFTKRVVENLRKYARQVFRGLSYTTGLIADIADDYMHLIPDARTDQEILTRFPYPLHQHLAGDEDLPVMLAPVPREATRWPPLIPAAETREMTVRLEYAAGEDVSLDEMMKWIRRLPKGIRTVRMDYSGA